MKQKILIYLLATLLVSCGGSHQPHGQAQEANLGGFQFQLTGGNLEWKRLPDYSKAYFQSDFYRPGQTHQNIIVSGNEIMLKSVIDVAKFNEGLFLSWPGKLHGKSITMATAYYEKVDLLNQGEGRYQAIPAGYDQLQDHWFIPMDVFLKKPISSNQTHWVTLSLVTDEATRELIHIGMRFRDSSPQIQVREIESEAKINKDFSGWNPSKPFSISRQLISNLAEQSVELELTFQARLSYITGIGRENVVIRNSHPSVIGHYTQKISLPVKATGVMIHDYQRGSSYFRGVHQPMTLSIGAGESVEVEWLLETLDGKRCALPAAKPIHYTTNRFRGKEDLSITQKQVAYARYRVDGTLLGGHVERGIQVSQAQIWHKNQLVTLSNGIHSSYQSSCPDCPKMAKCWF